MRSFLFFFLPFSLDEQLHLSSLSLSLFGLVPFLSVFLRPPPPKIASAMSKEIADGTYQVGEGPGEDQKCLFQGFGGTVAPIG